MLFDSVDILIIIGHGHFDSSGCYYIGDYSEEWIQYYAQKKDTVALLGCYSAAVELSNNLQLTYQGRIDLLTAMNDLSELFEWTKMNAFLLAQNFYLHDLVPGDPGDPGGGGGGSNGWSVDNLPPV